MATWSIVESKVTDAEVKIGNNSVWGIKRVSVKNFLMETKMIPIRLTQPMPMQPPSAAQQVA